MPLFDPLIHNVLLECRPSLKQMQLQLWQNKVTLNTRCNVDKSSQF